MSSNRSSVALWTGQAVVATGLDGELDALRGDEDDEQHKSAAEAVWTWPCGELFAAGMPSSAFC